MKSFEQGQEKLQKICQELKESTLAPAKKEANAIINEAHARAQEIIKESEKEAENLIKAAKVSIEQEKNIFQSSLSQGIKQGLESLKQDIEHKLFNDQLNELVIKGTRDPEIISKLINTIVSAIEKEGISADISVIVPKEIPEHDVNILLASEILNKLKQNSVEIGSFSGGAQVRVGSQGLTIDITDRAIEELLARYIRKDFRKLIFAK